MSSTLDNDPQEITPSEDSPAARNLGDELVGPFKVRQGKTLRWTNVNMTLVRMLVVGVRTFRVLVF